MKGNVKYVFIKKKNNNRHFIIFIYCFRTFRCHNTRSKNIFVSNGIGY